MATEHYSTMSYRDKTGETSSFTIYNDAITAVSIAAFLAQLTTFRAKTEALLLGFNYRNTWVGDADINGADLPASNYAQRENKLRVLYKDTTTGEVFELTLPTIDLSKLTFIPGAKDFIQFAGAGVDAAITEWVTAFEAIASPPSDMTHNVQVTGMQFVGRNS